MAKATGLSQSTISRIWRAFSLDPHRAETFKLSRDPLFIDKVRDIVGLYLNPPDRALVLCVDEKSPIQALDRTAPLLPMRPARRSGAPTTTSATAPPASSPPSTPGPDRTSSATARWSSATSSTPSRRCPKNWTFP
jgi:hypothetical protein